MSTPKEATVYIVDCGRTMGETGQGRTKRNLDWALDYVWDKITATAALNRVTALVAVVGLRTNDTRNQLSSDEGYEHISVFQELGQIFLRHLRSIKSNLKVSNTNEGDAISAIVVAIDMITKQCKKLQYLRKIVLVTDGRNQMLADDLSEIVTKLKEDNIALVILGVDFDDSGYGVKEQLKSPVKSENEAIFRKLCNDCNGSFGTLDQAISELGIPAVKTTRSQRTYKGPLTLGDGEKFPKALRIDVERYPKTMPAKAPTASNFVVRGDIATQSTQAMAPTLAHGETVPINGLASVKNARTYQVKDEDAPGGRKDVPVDELSKGYEYGRTAVHISESDESVTKLDTTPSLDIIGFVDKNQYCRYLEMERTSLIVPAKTDDESAMALSSFIHALYELDSYAVARFVQKEKKPPIILLLAPNIEPEFECLYDTQLPFAEDVRSYRFPPLDRVVTVSGKVLHQHRNLPTSDIQDAMNSYVDKMDLSTFGKDDEGNNVEYASMDETPSPALHRVSQAIRHRAIFPDSEPPPPQEALTEYSHPPKALVEDAQSSLDRVISTADVKKVPPKARGRRYGGGRGNRDADKPLSNLDVKALLASDPNRDSKRIDSQNAVPEFKQVIANAESVDEVRDACSQLQRIIFEWIAQSTETLGHGKSIEAIRVMREEALELEEPGLYNAMLRQLKDKIVGGDLGGKREAWYLIKANRLHPISQSETGVSDLDDQNARSFMLLK